MRSLPKTIAILGALCAAAVALALGVTVAVGRAGPSATDTRFAPVPIVRFDVHQHLTAGTGEEAERLARAQGMGALVNWSGGAAGAGLEASLAAARGRRVRMLVLMNLDGEGCCAERWSAREAARLADGQAAGARGLALPSRVGGRSVGLDDPALDPIFAACERLGLPVFVHSGDPAALERRVARNPRLAFVASGFAGARDPGAVAGLLARLPNLRVDTAALGAIGRSPDGARATILAHADRVLLGTDVRLVEIGEVKSAVFGGAAPGGRREMLRFFDATWRFFETRDRGIPSPVAADGDATIDGIGLPRDVLERVYHRNAEALLGVRAEELW